MIYGYIDPFVGSQLKQRREIQQLTIEEVATRLRLSREYIEDIEDSQFTKLPHTYLNGYVRAYAKLLAVPEEEVNVYLMNTNKKNSLKGWALFSSHKQLSMSNRYFQWLTFVIISTLMILAAFWWRSDRIVTNMASDTMPEDTFVMFQHDIKANK